MYYRNAQASAVVYDVTKAATFEKAKLWVKELQRQANPNIVIALVGNKLDLLGDEGGAADGDEASTGASREVPTAEAQQYADEAGLLFFETSAKTGQGVLEVFTEIAKHIPLDQLKPKTGPGAENSGDSRSNLVDLQRRNSAATTREGLSLIHI